MLALFPSKKLKKQIHSSLCTGFLNLLEEKITTPSDPTYLIRFTYTIKFLFLRYYFI